MRIKAIVPLITDAYNGILRRDLESVKDSETEIDIVNIRHGPESIEGYYDEEICLMDTLKEAKKAEAEGYDSVLILCAGDPGLQAAREILDIPICGIMEASVHLASILGRRFSYITILKEIAPLMKDRIMLFGLESRCAGVRTVEIPVLDLDKDYDRMFSALLNESRKAMEEDGADTVVLGCAGMAGVAKELSKELGIPVIDPNVAGLKMAEMLVKLGMKQSRRAYWRPREKNRILD